MRFPEVVGGSKRDTREYLKDRLACVVLDNHTSKLHRSNSSLRLNEEWRKASISSELVPELGQVIVGFGRTMAGHEEREGCHEAVSTRTCLGSTAIL